MNYCKYCGKPLNEQGFCDCEDARKERETMDSSAATTVDEILYDGSMESFEDAKASETNPSSPIEASMNENQDFNQWTTDSNTTNTNSHEHKPNVFKTALKNVFPFLKALVKSPANTIHTCAENVDLPLAGLVYGFYVIAILLCVLSSVSNFMKLINTITSLFTWTGERIVKVSYPWLIVSSILIGILMIVITNIILLLFGFCFHNTYKVKQTLAASCAIFVYPMISYLLTAIFMYISVPAGILILSIGNITYLFMFFYTMKTLFKKNDNSPFLLIAMLLVAIVSLITTFGAVKLTTSFSNKLIKTNTSSYRNDYFNNDYYEEDEDYYSDDYYSDYFDDFFN